jgi:nucleoside triphosphate pyrophosphatase
MKRKIVLASGSPRRKKLLEQIGLDFTVEVSNYHEKTESRMKPAEFVELQSLEKAKLVAAKHKGAIIIGADTVVVLEDEIIGKPKTKKEAKEILKKLSGKTHDVFTGYTVMDTDKNLKRIGHVKTRVRFKKLSDEEISIYLKKEEVMDKAGAYGIQEKGVVFIDRIEGDYSNVVGLPIIKISEILKDFGINILE